MMDTKLFFLLGGTDKDHGDSWFPRKSPKKRTQNWLTKQPDKYISGTTRHALLEFGKWFGGPQFEKPLGQFRVWTGRPSAKFSLTSQNRVTLFDGSRFDPPQTVLHFSVWEGRGVRAWHFFMVPSHPRPRGLCVSSPPLPLSLSLPPPCFSFPPAPRAWFFGEAGAVCFFKCDVWLEEFGCGAWGKKCGWSFLWKKGVVGSKEGVSGCFEKKKIDGGHLGRRGWCFLRRDGSFGGGRGRRKRETKKERQITFGLFWKNVPRQGMHLKTMWNKQRCCGQLQNHVSIANFRGESGEIAIPSKSSNFFMVWWHEGSCKEMCGTILWVGKQDDSATPQSIYSVRRWPPLQRTRNKIFWRIVTRDLRNCSEILPLDTCWTTWLDHWISLCVQLQNGSKPVTNVWIDKFHLFITLVNTYNIVMWVTLQNNADWLTLRGRSWRFKVNIWWNPMHFRKCFSCFGLTRKSKWWKH